MGRIVRPGGLADYANPFALLFLACSRAVDFGTFLRGCLGGDGRGGFVFFCDETTPGNPLRPDKGRKIMNIYYTVKQFPNWFRGQSHAWLSFVSVPEVDLDRVAGGLSAIVRAMVRIFFAPSGHNPSAMRVSPPMPLHGDDDDDDDRRRR